MLTARVLAYRLGQTVQELGEDRARIAAGAVESGVGGETGGVADAARRPAAELGRRRPQRRRQVGAGVGVGHREDVDAVERLAVAHHGQRTRLQGMREAGAVESLHLLTVLEGTTPRETRRRHRHTRRRRGA